MSRLILCRIYEAAEGGGKNQQNPLLPETEADPVRRIEQLCKGLRLAALLIKGQVMGAEIGTAMLATTQGGAVVYVVPAALTVGMVVALASVYQKGDKLKSWEAMEKVFEGGFLAVSAVSLSTNLLSAAFKVDKLPLLGSLGEQIDTLEDALTHIIGEHHTNKKRAINIAWAGTTCLCGFIGSYIIHRAEHQREAESHRQVDAAAGPRAQSMTEGLRVNMAAAAASEDAARADTVSARAETEAARAETEAARAEIEALRLGLEEVQKRLEAAVARALGEAKAARAEIEEARAETGAAQINVSDAEERVRKAEERARRAEEEAVTAFEQAIFSAARELTLCLTPVEQEQLEEMMPILSRAEHDDAVSREWLTMLTSGDYCLPCYPMAAASAQDSMIDAAFRAAVGIPRSPSPSRQGLD